jgi:hypothetical protein
MNDDLQRVEPVREQHENRNDLPQSCRDRHRSWHGTARLTCYNTRKNIRA